MPVARPSEAFPLAFRRVPDISQACPANEFKVCRSGEAGACGYAKVSKRRTDGCQGLEPAVLQEVALLQRLHHPNVVGLLDFFCDLDEAIVVLEWAETTLKQVLRKRELPVEDVRCITKQILSGLDYCHSNSVILGCLSAGRVLLAGSEPPLEVRLTGFSTAHGFSLPLRDKELSRYCMWYAAPEVLLGARGYSLEVDSWSAGCLVGEMATGWPLWAGDSEISTLFQMFMKLGTPSEDTWPELAVLPHYKTTFPKWRPTEWEAIRNLAPRLGKLGLEMLDSLLQMNPRCRSSARRALSHPWLLPCQPSVSPGGVATSAAQGEGLPVAAKHKQSSRMSILRTLCRGALPILPAVITPLVDSFAAGWLYLDPRRAVDYAEDIDRQLRAQETFVDLPTAFLLEPVRFAPRGGRALLVDRLIWLTAALDLDDEVLFLAVSIFDRFLANGALDPSLFLQAAVAACLIAVKFASNQRKAPKDQVDALLVACTDAWALKQEDVVKMELTILRALNFDVRSPTVSSFLGRLLGANKCDARQASLARYLAELALLYTAEFRHPPSHVAAAAVLVSSELSGQLPAWPPALAALAGSAASLEDCVRRMRSLPGRADQASVVSADGSSWPLQGVFDKYSADRRHRVALEFAR